MNVLSIKLRVKFRVAGITLGTVTEKWTVPLPPILAGAEPQVILIIDTRGVRLDVAVTAPEGGTLP